MTLKEGDLAPDFVLPDTLGGDFCLSDYRGQHVVLYFYPKDDTPGCTLEAQAFTKMAGQFAEAGAVVCGISYDDSECHKAFIEKYNLKVELLADAEQAVAKLYESAGDGYAQRNTFVIDPDGRIKKIFRAVKPQGHAEEVFAVLRQS